MLSYSLSYFFFFLFSSALLSQWTKGSAQFIIAAVSFTCILQTLVRIRVRSDQSTLSLISENVHVVLIQLAAVLLTANDEVKTTLSESKAEVEELNQSQHNCGPLAL